MCVVCFAVVPGRTCPGLCAASSFFCVVLLLHSITLNSRPMDSTIGLYFVKHAIVVTINDEACWNGFFKGIMSERAVLSAGGGVLNGGYYLFLRIKNDDWWRTDSPGAAVSQTNGDITKKPGVTAVERTVACSLHQRLLQERNQFS